jgi:hypothetical protein
LLGPTTIKTLAVSSAAATGQQERTNNNATIERLMEFYLVPLERQLSSSGWSFIGVFWSTRFKNTTATRTALNPTTATLANLGALPPKLTLKELDPLVLSLDRDPLSALGYATAAGPSDRASYGTMLQLVQ